VHLLGTAYATHAVWPLMREQGYGRVLMTSSSSGLGGNFGQANYAAAKAGIVGLAKTLSLEGAKHDIRVNLIAPSAGTRMTEDIFPEEAYNAFTPETVAAAAAFLVSENGPANVMMGAGGGVYQCFWLTMNDGVLLAPEYRTAEGVAAAWAQISDRTSDAPLAYGMEQQTHAMEMLTKAAGKSK
ncbi:MAG: SDR family NAD(P)-dependent oxidoreductase, partial [Novosphingobium sp.]|nr:SDR family NAD(P)-dependent oxidoreductase [Novosphingobium sp.]